MTENYSDDSGGPCAVELPGEGKPVPSNKIEGYFDNDFWHYYGIYTNHKHLGPPFDGGWVEYPPWYCSLIQWFDSTVDLVRAHNEREAYKTAGAR